MAEQQINEMFARLKQHESGIIGEREAQHSAVALPIIHENQTPSLLFQVRSYQLKHQPGDICFPGGKMEDIDVSSAETAARELCEETGIERFHASHITMLDRWMMPYGIVIHPHVFAVTDTSFVPSDEVEELFTVPIHALQNQEPKTYMMSTKTELPADFPYEKIFGGKNYPFRQTLMPELFYEYNGKHIWGLTARILQHFLRVIQPS